MKIKKKIFYVLAFFIITVFIVLITVLLIQLFKNKGNDYGYYFQIIDPEFEYYNNDYLNNEDINLIRNNCVGLDVLEQIVGKFDKNKINVFGFGDVRYYIESEKYGTLELHFTLKKDGSLKEAYSCCLQVDKKEILLYKKR